MASSDPEGWLRAPQKIQAGAEAPALAAPVYPSPGFRLRYHLVRIAPLLTLFGWSGFIGVALFSTKFSGGYWDGTPFLRLVLIPFIGGPLVFTYALFSRHPAWRLAGAAAGIVVSAVPLAVLLVGFVSVVSTYGFVAWPSLICGGLLIADLLCLAGSIALAAMECRRMRLRLQPAAGGWESTGGAGQEHPHLPARDAAESPAQAGGCLARREILRRVLTGLPVLGLTVLGIFSVGSEPDLFPVCLLWAAMGTAVTLGMVLPSRTWRLISTAINLVMGVAGTNWLAIYALMVRQQIDSGLSVGGLRVYWLTQTLGLDARHGMISLTAWLAGAALCLLAMRFAVVDLRAQVRRWQAEPPILVAPSSRHDEDGLSTPMDSGAWDQRKQP
ncbi:MAG: hypothetical protein ACREJ2_03495 [Planctomycetota bacterium]